MPQKRSTHAAAATLLQLPQHVLDAVAQRERSAAAKRAYLAAPEKTVQAGPEQAEVWLQRARPRRRLLADMRQQQARVRAARRALWQQQLPEAYRHRLRDVR